MPFPCSIYIAEQAWDQVEVQAGAAKEEHNYRWSMDGER